LGRQPLWRRVSFLPHVTYFKPSGVPLAQLKEIRLSIEEAEAIRLKDLEGLEQEECAEKMNVSRPTFARELNTARYKIAAALINGLAIRIDGGNFEMTQRRFRCANGHEWDAPVEVITSTPAFSCPTCNTSDILPMWPPGQNWDKGNVRRRHGRNRNW
jgi:predicted DNA-binding protein (UPF0251 family)